MLSDVRQFFFQLAPREAEKGFPFPAQPALVTNAVEVYHPAAIRVLAFPCFRHWLLLFQ
jgi:hypothetical protein